MARCCNLPNAIFNIIYGPIIQKQTCSYRQAFSAFFAHDSNLVMEASGKAILSGQICLYRSNKQ